MEHDLATLPVFFSQPGDLIIIPQKPSTEYLHILHEVGISNREFVTMDMLEKLPPENINRLCPWGWSPAVHKRLNFLKDNCSENFKNSPVFNWETERRNLYSKKFAREILHQLVEKYPSEHFITKDELTEICTSKEEFEILLEKWDKLMVKAPWSSSGRGLQPITKTPVHPKVWEKLLGIVNDQGYAIAEPLLNKQLDLAYQFKLEKGRVSFVGTSNFTADSKGQYMGNSLNGLPDDLNPELKEFVQKIPSLVIDPLIKLLENSDLAKSFEGFFGVDTLIFRDKQGQLKINPCLEINVRYNMGLLSVHFGKLIFNNKKGLFRTYYKPGSSFYNFKKEMEAKYPLILKEGKIESGFFPVTDAQPDTMFGAYILV